VSTNGGASPKRGPGELSVHGRLPRAEVEAHVVPAPRKTRRPSRDTFQGLVRSGRRSSTAQENCILPHVFPWVILGGLLPWRNATSWVPGECITEPSDQHILAGNGSKIGYI
jgi:hypothetical protein